ncbi:MAG: extracellular solute-binding protein [Dactylosporangium sp.]|nr:extracellular solute-binding protein [Dactylosporangium sp.]
MRMLRWARVTAVAAALVLATAACGSDSDSGSGSGGQVQLSFSWWGDASRAKATQDAVDLFQKKFPNIKVTTQYAPFGDFFTKLATQVAGGNAPDLFQIDRGYVNEYAQRGALYDISKFSSELDLSKWDQSFANSGKIDGKLVAVPFAQNSQTIVIDKTLLDKYGVPLPDKNWTWDDLAAWAKQVYDKSGGKVHGFADPGSTYPAFESWLVQHGKHLYDDQGKLGYTAQDVADFWNFCTQLRKSGAATTAELTATITGTPADEPLPKGKAAAEWDYDSLYTLYVAATKDELVMYPLPQVNGNTGMLPKPAQMLSVYSKSKHPKEAVQLMNFLLNDPEAAKALGASRGLQPNLDIRADMASSATDPAVKAVYAYEAENKDKLNPASVTPPKGDSQVLTLMQRMYQEVAFERQSVQKAAESFYSQVQQTIGG